MEEFSIYGNGDFIKITFDEVYDYPEKTSSWGGYEVRALLEIKSSVFTVKAILPTSTGEIYDFYDSLKQRNNELYGVVYYRTFEENLELKLEYDTLGHINVNGSFSERNQFQNELIFEFNTDQSYINSTLTELKQIVEKYGNWKGIRK